MRIILLISFLLLLQSNVLCQSASGTDSSSDLPTTFLISEDDRAYGELVSSTPVLLLEVCNNSMDEAYKKWIYMLADIEEKAAEEGFEIRGLKIWMNVFWSANGNISHIVCYPKPNSKNIEYNDFTKFLNRFAKDYKLDVKSNKSFAHYGSASFPTFVEQMFPERKK